MTIKPNPIEQRVIDAAVKIIITQSEVMKEKALPHEALPMDVRELREVVLEMWESNGSSF